MDMYTTSPETKQELLVKGRVYRFKARNFSLGVYDGNGGFIGVREKFWYPYPFTEYHCDPPWSSTVWAIEPTEFVLPDDLEVREYFESRCGICEQPSEFEPNIPFKNAPGRNYHVDRTLDADHDPHRHTYLPTNWALMKWLAQFEEDDEYQEYVIAYADAESSDERAELHNAWAEKMQAKNEAYRKEREE